MTLKRRRQSDILLDTNDTVEREVAKYSRNSTTPSKEKNSISLALHTGSTYLFNIIDLLELGLWSIQQNKPYPMESYISAMAVKLN